MSYEIKEGEYKREGKHVVRSDARLKFEDTIKKLKVGQMFFVALKDTPSNLLQSLYTECARFEKELWKAELLEYGAIYRRKKVNKEDRVGIEIYRVK